MQKHDCLKQISNALQNSNIDLAVGLWMGSYQRISANEFVELATQVGWHKNHLLDILKEQKKMYEVAIDEIEHPVFKVAQGSPRSLENHATVIQ